MRSSDARYYHVQRTKRDMSAVDAWQQGIVAALAAGEVPEPIIRESAAEFTHLLLACGRTANDFRRNFRRGPALWNIVAANDLADIQALRDERLDGFSVLRLSREQVRTVRSKWQKLRDQDYLLHDPQGSAWLSLLRAKMTAERDGLSLVAALRQGEQLSLLRFAGDEQAQYAWHRERDLAMRPKAHVPFASDYDEEAEHEAQLCFSIALADYLLKWRKNVDEPQPRIRKRIELNLVVAEAFISGQGFSRAYYDPDSSSRHCSEKSLRERIEAIRTLMGDRWRDIIEAQQANWGEAIEQDA